MNEQQLAAVKQALGALKKGTGWMEHGEIITALQSIISQDALDKKAENARELGLSYDDAPKTWVGLTNDEVNNFAAGCHLGNSVQDAIYKAEAKLKEKNT